MATAVRNAARGLSTDDLQAIRDGLAAGRKPRVMFTDTAGQIAGQVGQVVGLTDPDLSDEWVVVRFGRDELPFSPTDLRIPPRGAAARKADPAPPAPELKVVREKPAPRQEKPVPETSTMEKPAPVPAPPEAGTGDAKPARKPAAGKGPKVKAPPSLTVTLAYTDGEWTVAAQQGTKALAKPYLIKPTDALKMVGLLDVPGVQEAVEHILATERADAEQQAQRLRAELAEIEAKLAELRVSD
jgi:hypothetical protein